MSDVPMFVLEKRSILLLVSVSVSVNVSDPEVRFIPH